MKRVGAQLVEDLDEFTYVDVEIIQIFADAQKLKHNGHTITHNNEDWWNGSWDNAVTLTEDDYVD